MATDNRTVLLTPEQHARETLAREMEELKKNPLDVAKRPGGEYLGTDGKPHDAEGRPIAKGAKPEDWQPPQPGPVLAPGLETAGVETLNVGSDYPTTSKVSKRGK